MGKKNEKYLFSTSKSAISEQVKSFTLAGFKKRMAGPSELLVCSGVTVTRSGVAMGKFLTWSKRNDASKLAEFKSGCKLHPNQESPNATKVRDLLNIISLCRNGAYGEMKQFIEDKNFDTQTTFLYKSPVDVIPKEVTLLDIAIKAQGENSKTTRTLIDLGATSANRDAPTKRMAI